VDRLNRVERQFNINRGTMHGWVPPRELPVPSMPGRRKGYDGAQSDQMDGTNVNNYALSALSGHPYAFNQQIIPPQMNGWGQMMYNNNMNGMGGIGQPPFIQGIGGMGPPYMDETGMGTGPDAPYGHRGFRDVSP
jgi:hypothetical protein